MLYGMTPSKLHRLGTLILFFLLYSIRLKRIEILDIRTDHRIKFGDSVRWILMVEKNYYYIDKNKST
jgi:hypothetical protein